MHKRRWAGLNATPTKSHEYAFRCRSDFHLSMKVFIGVFRMLNAMVVEIQS